MLNDLLEGIFKKIIASIKEKSIGTVEYSKGEPEEGIAIVSEKMTVFVVNELPIVVPTGAIRAIHDLLTINDGLLKTGEELDSLFHSIIHDMDQQHKKEKKENPFPGRQKDYTLPSGRHVHVDWHKNDFYISTTEGGPIEVLLSGADIARLDGILYPTKVHGKWKGHCGEGPAETPQQKDERILKENGISKFEEAIKEVSERNT